MEDEEDSVPAPPRLPTIGTRVFVTGTRHHGFRGGCVTDYEGRGVWVQLDEWDEPQKFYLHQLIEVLPDKTLRHFTDRPV